jgi:Pyruvate/2-oxoacid:ferredoxin oxidoreductase gamma subunit
MEISGRPMECYVVIDPPPMDDRALREWLELAVAFVPDPAGKAAEIEPGRCEAK